MEQYERDAREAVAKALEENRFPDSAYQIRRATEHSGTPMGITLRALLPLLATSDLERRALEACESLYSDYKDSLADLTKSARNACAIGRESLAAKKGPWVVTSQGNVAAHTDGRSVAFWDNRKGFDHAACAAFVAEQNEREAGRV